MKYEHFNNNSNNDNTKCDYKGIYITPDYYIKNGCPMPKEFHERLIHDSNYNCHGVEYRNKDQLFSCTAHGNNHDWLIQSGKNGKVIIQDDGGRIEMGPPIRKENELKQIDNSNQINFNLPIESTSHWKINNNMLVKSMNVGENISNNTDNNELNIHGNILANDIYSSGNIEAKNTYLIEDQLFDIKNNNNGNKINFPGNLITSNIQTDTIENAHLIITDNPTKIHLKPLANDTLILDKVTNINNDLHTNDIIIQNTLCSNSNNNNNSLLCMDSKKFRKSRFFSNHDRICNIQFGNSNSDNNNNDDTLLTTDEGDNKEDIIHIDTDQNNLLHITANQSISIPNKLRVNKEITILPKGEEYYNNNTNHSTVTLNEPLIYQYLPSITLENNDNGVYIQLFNKNQYLGLTNTNKKKNTESTTNEPLFGYHYALCLTPTPIYKWKLIPGGYLVPVSEKNHKLIVGFHKNKLVLIRKEDMNQNNYENNIIWYTIKGKYFQFPFLKKFLSIQSEPVNDIYYCNVSNELNYRFTLLV